MMLMIVTTLAAHAQSTLSLRVENADGQRLSNANIKITGKHQLFGQTDTQGAIEFPKLANDEYQIVVSYVGYLSNFKKVTLKTDKSLTIILQADQRQTEAAFVQATRAKPNAATTFKNINKESINKNNIGQDIPYLLDQTPSVVISSDAGAGIGYTSMTIRGSNNERINVTLDGIPLNDAESMGSFFVNLPDFASSVDNIQIQRGIGTSTNGAGAFGASLNIQTSPLIEQPYAELNNTFGSYNSWKNTLKVGTGLLKEKYAFNARLSRIASDGYVERASSDMQSFYVDGGYFGKKQILKATLFSGKQKTYQAWYGTPEPLLFGDRNKLADYAAAMEITNPTAVDRLLGADRRYNIYDYPDQTDNYTQTHARLQYSNQLNEKLNFNLALHYTRGAGYYEEFRENDELAKYLMPPKNILDTLIKTTDLVRRRWLSNNFYGTTFAVNYKANKQLELSVGGAFNQYRGEHFGEVIWSRFASTAELGDRYYFNKATKNDFNIYTKLMYTSGNWLLNLDLQYRALHYRIAGDDDKVKDIALHDDLHFFNPKAGITYQFSNQANIYLSYAFANKEPIRKDYVENPLKEFPKPEQMQNIEAGYRLRNATINLGLNAYAMLYNNQLIPTGAINPSGSPLRHNVKDSYRVGLELDASWAISNHFRWSATVALSQNKIKNFVEYFTIYDENWDPKEIREIRYEKTNIALSPNCILSNEFSYSPNTALSFAVASKYVSRQYLDNSSENASSIKAFTNSNFRTTYTFKALGLEEIGLNLTVNNIFNAKYASNGNTWGGMDEAGNRSYYNFYYPQAGTNFMLGLNLRF